MHKFKRNIPINALACMLHDISSKEGQTLMKSRIILEAELKRVDYSVLICFQVVLSHSVFAGDRCNTN